jgi:hypothetical protein
MDSEIERFRVDPEIRAQAAQSCERQGLELGDVLRAFVAVVARGDDLSFVSPPKPVIDDRSQDDGRLWTDLKHQVEAETAVGLLIRFIARCSVSIADASDLTTDQLAHLKAQRVEAIHLRSTLDVTDRVAVQNVIQQYGPLVRHDGD